MIKVEIKLNKKKIRKERKYTPEYCEEYLKKLFDYYNFDVIETKDAGFMFYGNNELDDLAKFGNIVVFLRGSDIFQYIEKIVWYNMDNYFEDDNLEYYR